MSSDTFPQSALVTSWNELDQIGRLVTDAGEELKFGRSACRDFVPSVQAQCWVHEAGADRAGPMRRATMVSATHETPRSREALAAEAQAARAAEAAEPVVPTFVPPLLDLLVLRERQLGRPLSEQEVWEMRDRGVCMMMRISAAKMLAAKRGYDDLDPKNAWSEWQTYRSQLPRS